MTKTYRTFADYQQFMDDAAIHFDLPIEKLHKIAMYFLFLNYCDSYQGEFNDEI